MRYTAFPWILNHQPSLEATNCPISRPAGTFLLQLNWHHSQPTYNFSKTAGPAQDHIAETLPGQTPDFLPSSPPIQNLSIVTCARLGWRNRIRELGEQLYPSFFQNLTHCIRHLLPLRKLPIGDRLRTSMGSTGPAGPGNTESSRACTHIPCLPRSPLWEWGL